MEMKRIETKALSEISGEWDALCEVRQNAIDKGADVSLLSVTMPCIMAHVLEELPKRVLDIGCGTGYMVGQIAKYVDFCCGIDMSSCSVALAKERYSASNISFVNAHLNDYQPTELFDMCISNMAICCDPDLKLSLEKCFGLLKDNGLLLVMVPHPCFWANYWGYFSEPWFDYKSEIYIEHDFSISLVKSMGKSTFIHRPLSLYLNELICAGFVIEKVEEPYPIGDIPKDYEYFYPRFMMIKCRKKSNSQI